MSGITKLVMGIGISLLGALVVLPVLAADVPAAKQALALANEKVDAEVQDRVIRLIGKMSDSNLRPRLWEITLYDTTRLNDGVQVRVKDGAVASVSSSVRMFDDGRWKNFSRNFSGYWPGEVIDVGRWAVDSDQVVNTARTHPKLAGYELTEVSLVLRKLSDGDVPPHWRIRLRARPADNPTRERWVGYLQYNAETGELLKEELTIGN